MIVDIRAGLGTFDLEAAFTAESGQTVALVGPNGAGKTTLLRVICGLVPSVGRINLRDTDLQRTATHKRGIGAVFAGDVLFPNMSVLDNVAFAPRCLKTSVQIANDLLTSAGLDYLSNRRPQQLSSGQARRVALLRALASRPSLLLLDEPFAHLDIRARSEVRKALSVHLETYSGVTILTGHEAADIVNLADKIIVLEDGRITQTGTSPEVSANPRTDFSKQFWKTLNS